MWIKFVEVCDDLYIRNANFVFFSFINSSFSSSGLEKDAFLLSNIPVFWKHKIHITGRTQKGIETIVYLYLNSAEGKKI